MDGAEQKLQDDAVQTTAVELVSSDSITNVTADNATKLPDQEQIDFEKLLDDWKHLRNLPSVTTVLYYLTNAVYIGLSIFLDYYFYGLLDALSISEAPQVTVPARATPWTSKKDDSDETPRVEINQTRQITSSLRTTTRHLYRIGGPFAGLRGLAPYLCCQWVGGIFMMAPLMFFGLIDDPAKVKWDHTISSRLTPDLKNFLAESVMIVLFSSWDTAWVHVAITQPTLRIWYRRLPPFFSTLRATWRPLLLSHTARFVIWRVIPRILRWSVGFYAADFKDAEGFITSDKILRSCFWLIVNGTCLLVWLPVHMAATRVQVSLLPEEEETIVPVDRSFGTNGPNGLQPGLLAESRGPLSMNEAWRSVTWDELRRVVVLRAKFVAVQLVFSAVFWVVLGEDALPMRWVPWKYKS